MKKQFTVLFFLIFSAPVFSQNITGQQLLEKSVAYHDPSNKWPKFKGNINLIETRPDASERHTHLQLNNKKDIFKMEQIKDGDHLSHIYKNGECTHLYNHSKAVSKKKREEHKLSCKRTKLLRDYYVYLWGLPMKLKDDGTIVHKDVKQTSFQGKECLSIKVTYQESVGNDTWYFYFHPKTYALIGYRFYHDEMKNDGEYIMLDGEKTIQGMRIPKERKWYYNNDDKFLGSDILQ